MMEHWVMLVLRMKLLPPTLLPLCHWLRTELLRKGKTSSFRAKFETWVSSVPLPDVIQSCFIPSFVPGPFVQLWRKGSTLLFAGSLRVHQDPRIRLRESSLEIENVHTNDTGPYICQISTNPTIEITHHLSAVVRKPQDPSGTSRVPSGCRTKYFHSYFLSLSLPLSLLVFSSTFWFGWHNALFRSLSTLLLLVEYNYFLV